MNWTKFVWRNVAWYDVPYVATILWPDKFGKKPR